MQQLEALNNTQQEAADLRPKEQIDATQTANAALKSQEEVAAGAAVAMSKVYGEELQLQREAAEEAKTTVESAEKAVVEAEEKLEANRLAREAQEQAAEDISSLQHVHTCRLAVTTAYVRTHVYRLAVTTAFVAAKKYINEM